MTPSVASSSSTSATGTNPYAALAPAAPSSDVSKNMFLQLMVAQLQNQDPLNPTDSTQFVSELAQMQQLEQSVNMGQDVSAIRADLDQMVAASGASGTSNQGTSGTQSNGGN
jgi:flagellar basal-body rod modification protein FlgD